MHFLILPPEIRNYVYEFLLFPEGTRFDLSYEQWRIRGKSWPLRNLQGVCRQIREESLRFYYSTARFTARHIDLYNANYKAWLNLIQDRGARELRKLEFEGIMRVRITHWDPEAKELIKTEQITVEYFIRVNLFNTKPWYDVSGGGMKISRSIHYEHIHRNDQARDQFKDDQRCQRIGLAIVEPYIAFREWETRKLLERSRVLLETGNLGVGELSALMELANER
jgi:hypothetical protein